MVEIAMPFLGQTPEARLPARFSKPRLNRQEASEYLMLRHGVKVAVATLATRACTGGGPPFEKFNRTPLYPLAELDRWATDKLGSLRTSTSDGGL